MDLMYENREQALDFYFYLAIEYRENLENDISGLIELSANLFEGEFFEKERQLIEKSRQLYLSLRTQQQPTLAPSGTNATYARLSRFSSHEQTP